MEEAAEFQDWELLHGLDAVAPLAVAVSPPASATVEAPRGARGDSHGVINPDYFGLNTGSRSPRMSSSSDGDREGDGLPDSDDPSRVEPNPGSRFLDEPSREGLGSAAADVPRPDPGGLWTPEASSGGQQTPPHDHVVGALDSSVSSHSEVVLEVVNSDGGEGDGEGSCAGVTGETGVVEAGSEVSGELDSASDGPSITVVLPGRSNGDSDLESPIVAKGEKAGMVWWKLPAEILKFCIFRIRPVWSISIAAALIGVLMLGRRLYKKKPKSRSVPLKVGVDDKPVSQFMVGARRLNEAFSVVKRVPVIRSTLPTAGVTPWPVMALR